MRSLLAGAVVGAAIGYIDSRPGYDATGLTVVGLLAGAACCSYLAPPRLWLLAGVLVGMWVPLFERSLDSLAALGFALVGAAAGRFAFSARGVAHG